MTTLQFKCTLLTDVVLNARTATEGLQNTLDFIPGNCFLGIVANDYQRFLAEGKAADLFHNGKVRYGDAHPAVCMDGQQVRSLRIPATFYYPKLQSLTEKCYIHHAYNRMNDHDGNEGRPQQLKQCRYGFYAFNGTMAAKAECPVSYSVKSAYDRVERRAKDEQMYGYQSLDKGRSFFFEVEVDNDALVFDIKRALTGRKRIGRSRTAQYGLVEISQDSFTQPSSGKSTISIDGMDYITVYADSRLVFIDECGNVVNKIKAKDHLGIDGEIDWMKSQVRTFQYAPWNFKRQCRDADRYGVEKGSVFVVRTDKPSTSYPSHVGTYRNEGFGKIIVNPVFLSVQPDSNGLAAVSFIDPSPKDKTKRQAEPTTDGSSPLLSFLQRKEARAVAENFIYESVDAFVRNNTKVFKDKEFASQWGSIRSIAMRCRNQKELRMELFDKVKVVPRTPSADDPSTSKIVKTAYLTHGVAEKKWEEKNRIARLKDFFDGISEGSKKITNEDITIEAVIELASEMAKQTGKYGNE